MRRRHRHYPWYISSIQPFCDSGCLLFPFLSLPFSHMSKFIRLPKGNDRYIHIFFPFSLFFRMAAVYIFSQYPLFCQFQSVNYLRKAYLECILGAGGTRSVPQVLLVVVVTLGFFQISRLLDSTKGNDRIFFLFFSFLFPDGSSPPIFYTSLECGLFKER